MDEAQNTLIILDRAARKQAIADLLRIKLLENSSQYIAEVQIVRDYTEAEHAIYNSRRSGRYNCAIAVGSLNEGASFHDFVTGLRSRNQTMPVASMSHAPIESHLHGLAPLPSEANVYPLTISGSDPIDKMAQELSCLILAQQSGKHIQMTVGSEFSSKRRFGRNLYATVLDDCKMNGELVRDLPAGYRLNLQTNNRSASFIKGEGVFSISGSIPEIAVANYVRLSELPEFAYTLRVQ